MLRQFQILIAVTAALLFVAGCQTHDRVIYRNPLPWVSHPVGAPSELPGDTTKPLSPDAAAALPAQ